MDRAFDSGARIRRILFATDFSRSAQAALPHAVRLARLSDAQLYLAHVMKARPWEIRAELSLQRRIRATQRLDHILASPPCRGIHPQPVLRHGEAVAQLLQIAQDYAADLVVTGTRSQHGLAHLVFGSVAEKLAQCAPCPVLTIGPGARLAANGEIGFRNIVLATCTNRGAAVGIEYARAFANRYGANLFEVGWLEQVPLVAELESADLVMLAPGLGRVLPQIVPQVACPVMTVRYAIPMLGRKARAATPAVSS